MADISLSREQASFIILKSCVWSVIDCPVGRIMRGFLILSFHLVLFCSAQGEGQLEDIRTKVEKILIEKEDKSWADVIMFETIFLEIIQNSLQLPLEVAGQETKSESVLTVRKNNNARTKAEQGFVSNNEKLDKEGDKDEEGNKKKLYKEGNNKDEAKMGRRQTLAMARLIWMGRKGLRIM